jgi:chromosome partitioning protein
MILAVGNTKGGVGKTTLAVNLAVALALAGRDLLLVDGDEQGTALTFTELRAERLARRAIPPSRLPARRCAARSASSRPNMMTSSSTWADATPARCAPRSPSPTRSVPVQPRSFDVWALDQVSALVAEAREINEGLRAVAVLNGADAQGPTMRPPWR